MTAMATCGHELPAEPPDGSRRAEHATYCRACRDAALAAPGLALSTEEETLAWLRGAD